MTGGPLFRKRHPPRGARPGTLVVPDDAVPTTLRIISYDVDAVQTADKVKTADIPRYLARDATTWIDVRGIRDVEVLQAIGDLFSLHPLLLEDVVNVPQRPKFESYDDHQLLITRLITGGGVTRIEQEQVSIIVGPNYVLTIQERPDDPFDPIRTRIDQGKGLIRHGGSDYLAYALLDAVIDGYYPVVEAIGDALEDLESDVLDDPKPEVARKIQRLKRQLMLLRRSVWPHREAINTILREENDAFQPQVRTYLRDVYDHCVQLGDVVESFREMAGGLLDLYLSTMSNRTNDIMRVLTIMASVFIPLTFVAGVYGMNFDFMPELQFRYAYPLVVLAMVLVAMAMVAFFARRGWIGAGRNRDED
jgi:magnesium transporter